MKNTSKTPKYVHLSLEERKHLAYLYNRDDRGNLRGIATEMRRSHNTITLDIRAGLVDGVYEAEYADKVAKRKRKRSKTQLLKVVLDPALHKKVEADLRLKISPGRISGGLLEVEKKIVSPKAIYKFAESRNLKMYLCFKGKERKANGQYVYR